MRITNRLKINALLPIIGALVVISMLLWSEYRHHELRQQKDTAQEIVIGVYDLYVLTFYYLEYYYERPNEQWHIRHDSLLALTKRLVLPKPEQNLLVQRINRNLYAMDKLFTLLVSSHERGGAPYSGERAITLQDRLAAQLVIRTRAISGDSVRLANYVDQQVRENRQRSLILVVLVIFLTVTAIVAVSLLLNRKIITSLKVLKEGTEIIGAGKFDHRVDLPHTDEIGMLAIAFNDMTESLQMLTVSRDELAREVVERRQAEERLRLALSELERSNRELEQFAYVASHDLQEPLRMVASYVQLIARRYKGKLDETADQFISFAVDGANRMQRLINDLLTYSRVGTRSRPFAPTDCNAVFKQALANLAFSIKEKNGTVTAGDLPTLNADETQLVQLFQNLIGNALKFTGDRPPVVHVFAEEREDEWLFGVRDHGIGIDRQYLERIFMIFQRLHGRDEYPGTGIGLAICKKIVELHGGHIWVESVPGEGSTFYFTIRAKGVDHAQR